MSLHIIGDGPFKLQLQHLAEQKAVQVSFAGEQDLSYIKKALRSADLFVNPSYAEGLPTTVIEAAALGVNVVATDVGGTAEIVPPENLVPVKDIAQLRTKILHVQKLRPSTVSVQRFVRKQFGVQENAAALYALLKNTVKGKPF